MFFATTTAPSLRRQSYPVAGRTLERWLDDALLGARRNSASFAQDDKAFTLSFDLPGITREQLAIAIEGNVVRIETLEGAPRQYRSAYELPQDIDLTTSEAKLENGVLTVKLGKKVAASSVTRLAIN